MAFNGSGVFNRLYNWVTDKANAVAVTASRMDGEMDGFATGLTGCITKDGQTTTTARIPFASGTSAAAGTTASVAYSATNDANTGMYFPAADTVALVAGGTAVLSSTATAMTIDSGVTLNATNAVVATLAVTAGTLGGNALTAFPSGTRLPFQQTSAPTGWTKDTSATYSDTALRLVTGTATSGGGSVAFSTLFARTATDTFTIAQANLPASTNTGNQSANHTHVTAHGVAGILYASGANALNVLIDNQSSSPVNFTSGNQSASHAHDLGGSGTALSANIDLRVKYTDFIIAQKT